MKFDRMVGWITILLVYIMATKMSIDHDLWWHLRAGKWMIENRQLLTVDPFSLTRYGAEWQYPGWLIEIPMAAIESLFGLGGLNILTGLIITATFAILYCAIKGKALIRAFLIVLSATVSSVYWSTRPHLITLLFTAIFIYILERGTQKGFAKNRKTIWIVLPLIMLGWVNSHGGFIMGFVLWGVYLIDLIISRLSKDVLQKRHILKSILDDNFYTLVIAGMGMGLISILNPLGFGIYLYPFQTISIQALQKHIQEWQSPDFHSPSMQPFIWLLILLIGVSALTQKRWLFRDILLVSVFLYLALMAGRNVALFSLVAPLPIARVLENFEQGNVTQSFLFPNLVKNHQDGNRDFPLLNLFLVVAILGGGIYRSLLAYSTSEIQAEIQKSYPIGAVNYLRENRPQGNLFNSYNWGAYLLWVLPEYPVFVDGRTDLYNDEIIDQWLQVVQVKEGWEQVFEQWEIGVILMEKDWIAARFLQQQGWCQSYQDELAVVLVKCP